MTAAQAGAKSAGSRNARYPKVDLGEAVQMMRSVAVHGRSHSKAAVASYLGHDTLNSGSFLTKMGALRDWGFIEGRGDSLEVTDSGYAVAHASDPQTVAAVLRDAFTHARVFGDLYTSTAKGVPVRKSDIASRAVLEFGVAPAAKKGFLNTFLASAQAAECAAIEGDSVRFLDECADEGSAESDGPAPTESVESVSTKPRAGDKAVVLRQVWPGTLTDIVLEVRSNAPLPAAAFAKLGEIVTAIDGLVASLDDAKADDGSTDE